MLHIGNGAYCKVAHVNAKDKPEMKEFIIVPRQINNNTSLAFCRKAEKEENNNTGQSEKSFVFQMKQALNIE